MTKSPMLEQLMIDSGAPEEVMDQLWFHVFCANFAHNLIAMAETEVLE